MTEMHHNLEISTCDHLICIMGNSILILSTCLGKSIRMKGLKRDFMHMQHVSLSHGLAHCQLISIGVHYISDVLLISKESQHYDIRHY